MVRTYRRRARRLSRGFRCRQDRTVDGTADRWLRLPFTLSPDQAEIVAGVLREASLRAPSAPKRDLPVPRWTA
ncbi:hypothetical protein [Amycolatopsis eburnea]|uniref:Uncharacterized protein n=1 Tax=Amycolatopsis eburnea TaxID=2267691 RepID=A0A427T596_9PSEU|nr:hypothetical protein [Amycolatopsis eburnea]RSD14116.1 hypothetical protein EIY87_31285 [Amycolatopsis eburnea]